MRFWDALKEVSTRNIQNEANLRFYLGLAGDAESIRKAERAMFGPDATEEQIRYGRELLEERPAPFDKEDLDRLSLCHLVLILPNGPSFVQIRPAEVAMVSHPHDLIPTLLAARPAWRVALARRFPAFREPVADRLVADISRINTEFALITAVPFYIPVLAPVFPVNMATNLLMLTKNQVLLVCRLAAVYGLEGDTRRRLAEVAPVIGSGIGWRYAARALAGLVPGPVGAAVTGMIAYTGTFVAGKSAQIYYREGKQPNRERVRLLYEEASERAKSVVAAAMERVRSLPKAVEALPGRKEKELPPAERPNEAEPEDSGEPAVLEEE